MTFTEEEFKEWLENPMTKVIRQYLRKRIAEKQSAWVEGHFTSRNLQEGALLNTEALANAGAWQHMLNLTFEELEGVIYEE